MNPVFVNSLPKSGTHLLSKLLGLAGGREVYHFGSGRVLDTSLQARLRRIAMYPSIREKGVIIGIDSPVEVSRRFVEKKISSLSLGEFVTGHVGYNEDLLNICDAHNLKKICVVRDPRSIAVSFVHYVKDLERHYLHRSFSNLSFDDAIALCISGFSQNGKSLESLASRYRALEPWLTSGDVLVLRFEDLVGALGNGNDDIQKKTLKKVFEHLNIQDDGASDRVSKNLFGPGKATFRKGTVDSWKSELPEKSRNIIESELSSFFERFEYE